MSKKSKITEGKISVHSDLRDTVVHPTHGTGENYGKSGIGFEFGKSKLNKEGKQELKRRFESIKKLVLNTPHKVKIKGYASRPGTEENNQKLSEARAETVKQWLINEGVDGDRIDVSGFGEMLEVTTLTEAIEPLDDFDNPENRRATIEVEIVEVEPDDSEFTEMAKERIDDLPEDIKEAQDPIRQIIESIADLIAKEAHLEENPFGDAPSDNVDEFKEQVVERSKDAKPSIKTGVKYVLGSLFDMVRNRSAGKIREQRAQLYEPAAKAFAAAIDSNYQPDLSGLNQKEIAIYEHLSKKLKDKPMLDLYIIGALLVEKNLGKLVIVNELTEAQIRDYFNGDRIERGAKLFFEQPKYSVNDSYDEAGLEFQMKDGKLQILDPSEMVEATMTTLEFNVDGSFDMMEEAEKDSFNMSEDEPDATINMEEDAQEALYTADGEYEEAFRGDVTEKESADAFDANDAAGADSFDMETDAADNESNAVEDEQDGMHNMEDELDEPFEDSEDFENAEDAMHSESSDGFDISIGDEDEPDSFDASDEEHDDSTGSSDGFPAHGEEPSPPPSEPPEPPESPPAIG